MTPTTLPTRICSSHNSSRRIAHTPIAVALIDEAWCTVKFLATAQARSVNLCRPSAPSLLVISIGIPHADKSRYLTFRVRDSRHTLIDDFVFDETKR